MFHFKIRKSKNPSQVPALLVSAALIALHVGMAKSSPLNLNLEPPKVDAEDGSRYSAPAEGEDQISRSAESNPAEVPSIKIPLPVNYAKVPRLQSSKIPSKQEIQNSKFSYKNEDKNEENIVPDPLTTGDKETKPQAMSEDELVFQWRALKLNKNGGSKQKYPMASNDQEAEAENHAAVSEELDEHVPGGKDLVVYNTLASVRGADRRAQGAADGDGGDLQQKKGPFFRG